MLHWEDTAASAARIITMGDTTQSVICTHHGEGYATFVCHHLARGSGLGFFYGGDDLRPDAWCAECDRMVIKHGGEWNDETEAIAHITLLCSHCYDSVRHRNELPYQRLKRDYRPNLEDDGWELDNAQRLHLLYPETFDVPAVQEFAALCLGDLVKLIFLFAIKDEHGDVIIRGERMWVTIEQITPAGYVAQLENEPVVTDVVKPLDKIAFRQEHIAAIFIRKGDPRHPDFRE
jgi:hypothetical protein